MLKKLFGILLSLIILLQLTSCSSDDAEDLLDDIEDVIDATEREPIDVSRTGINAFANLNEFGSVCAQYAEVRDILNLRFVRVLFNWNDQVQPSPDSSIDFSFYDEILDCIPSGVDALVVVNGLPSWMRDSANWIDGNPRSTFIQLWLRRVINRYGSRGVVKGFQVWNEPDFEANSENQVLEILNSPSNYLSMLAEGFSVIRDVAPSKLVVNATTTSIVQDFPNALNYNRELVAGGLLNFVDIFAIHYYGQHFDRFIRGGGVREFLQTIPKPIWITESGRTGIDRQLEYVETIWPFLIRQIPSIERIYYYQFTSREPAGESFALRTNDSSNPVSDLYIHLRDRSRS